MGFFSWLARNWFELFQTGGIVAGLLFNAYALRRDEQARRISTLAAAKQDYLEIWKQAQERPELARVLDTTADLERHPVTPAERVFVKLLVIQLDSVHRAMRVGLFVSLEGLRLDVARFFSAPIPRAVWHELRPLQDSDFVQFVEGSTE